MNDRKEYLDKGKRELGKISLVHSGKEDYGFHTVWIGIDFKGSSQAFGGLALDSFSSEQKFIADLMKVFGVRDVKDLEGKACYALRAFGFFNDSIVGLESVDTNKRFILTNWARKTFPDSIIKGPLVSRRDCLLSDIAQAKRTIERCEAELKTIDGEYANWEE